MSRRAVRDAGQWGTARKRDAEPDQGVTDGVHEPELAAREHPLNGIAAINRIRVEDIGAQAMREFA